MGIPGFKTDEWRTYRQVPDSDVVYQIEDEMVSSKGEVEDGGILLDDNEETRTHGVMPVTSELERESRKRGLSIVSTRSRQGSPTKKIQLG